MALPTQAEIEQVIVGCCDEMMRIRREEFGGEWRDPANGPGLVLVSEALCSYLIPAASIPSIREALVPGILDDEVLNSSFESLVELSRDDFYGSPYISFSRIAKDGTDHGFIDGAAFAAAAILRARQVCWERIHRPLAKKLADTLCRALEFIVDAHLPGKGWSWGVYGKPEEPFLYATWTALETASEIVSDRKTATSISSKIEPLVKTLETQIEEARVYLQRTFIGLPESDSRDFNMDLEKGIIAFDDMERGLHYNLWAALSLLLVRTQRVDVVGRALEVVWREFQAKSERYKANDFDFFLDGTEFDGTQVFTDRAFVPLALKAFVKDTSHRTKQEMPESAEIISSLYSTLLGNRDTERYKFVWDKLAQRDSSYAIYTTERALESLCALHSVVPELSRYLPETHDSSSKGLTREEPSDAWGSIGQSICRVLSESSAWRDLELRVDRLEERVESLGNAGVDVDKLKAYGQEIEKLEGRIKKFRKDSDFGGALALAKEAVQRFPNSPSLKELHAQIAAAFEDTEDF